MARRRIRLGVAGLGRAFMLMLPTFVRDPRVVLVAAADPRPEAQARFAAEFGARAYASVEELCADPDLDAVYIATPHQFHAEHVTIAAAHGRHVLVEKPMALTLNECRGMIAASAAANVHLIVGHSHSFDAPYLATCRLIDSGAFGRVRMITALNFTDFLYRPRRQEELDTYRGGGVVFSQAAHQVDIVRRLGGGRVKSVRAVIGDWDPARPTEGAYAAHLAFEDGVVATLTYSGYSHFDSDEWMGGIGELGHAKGATHYGAARRALQRAGSPDAEAQLKAARAYGNDSSDARLAANAPAHQHFGPVIVSCERADLRPLPTGVMIYADAEQRLEPLPVRIVPRTEVIDELFDAVVNGKPPQHDGAWAMATLEVCLAIIESARQGRELPLTRQVGLGPRS